MNHTKFTGCLELQNPSPEDLSFLCDVDDFVAETWMDVVCGYDYGAVTAYLLRRFGPPNFEIAVPYKHGATWCLPIDREGVYLLIEPCPTKSTVAHMQASGVVRIAATQAVLFSSSQEIRDFIRQAIQDLLRPVGWRDRYATVAGMLSRNPDQEHMAPFFQQPE